MSDKQFKFSFLVGLVITALGALLLTQASVGFSLMAVGVGIAALALVNRRGETEALPETVAPLHTTASDA